MLSGEALLYTILICINVVRTAIFFMKKSLSLTALLTLRGSHVNC